MTTLEIINLIESDKKERKIVPSHAIMSEVISKAVEHFPISAKDIVTAEIKELVTNGIILIGDTINDKYIKIV